MEVVNVFLKRVSELSEKKCEFGFLNDYTFKSMTLAEGRFILEPQSIDSRTIGISHRKERNRRLTLYYVTQNDGLTDSRKEVEELEKLLKDMEQDREILSNIINFDYYCMVRNEKEAEKDTTGLIIFEINLDIKER
ncbi:MAG: hypothetical protein KBF12_10625 [Sebaldella sp.]|nr:hypothetical protein [Sebaldella sp.]